MNNMATVVRTLATRFRSGVSLAPRSEHGDTRLVTAFVLGRSNLPRLFGTYYGKSQDAQEPIRLHNIGPNPGATRDRKRAGRGVGSGTGLTCGYGHKGSKARGGGKGPFFEGGQTPYHRRIPKRGFKNGPDTSFETVSVDRIGMYVAMGRLQQKDGLLTMKDLQDAGVVQDIKYGVRLTAGGKANSVRNHKHAGLGRKTPAKGGEDRLVDEGAESSTARRTPEMPLPKGVRPLPAIHLEVSRASAGAIDYIESHGGTVTCAHFNRLSLRSLLKPHKFDELPMRARPPPKLLPYYLDYDRRGYLSPEVQQRNLKLFGFVTSEVKPEMPKIEVEV